MGKVDAPSATEPLHDKLQARRLLYPRNLSRLCYMSYLLYFFVEFRFVNSNKDRLLASGVASFLSGKNKKNQQRAIPARTNRYHSSLNPADIPNILWYSKMTRIAEGENYMDIKVKKLNKEDFDKFGAFVEAPNAEPTFQSGQFAYWKQLLEIRMGEVEIGMLKVRKYDMQLDRMERHAETAEMLIPVDGSVIIPVAPPSDTTPDPAKAEAFVVNQGQAVILGKNCWHWLPCPMDKLEVTLFVIFKNNTSETDLTVEELYEKCWVAS